MPNYYDLIKDDLITKNFCDTWSNFWLTEARQNGKNYYNKSRNLLDTDLESNKFRSEFEQEYLCKFINNNLQEVNKNMKLGELVIEKNGLENIFDGELVMLCPGYELEDFVVNNQDKSLRIITQKEVGIKKNNLKDFVLLKDYSVKQLGYNVKNGVFKLKVEYDLNVNVKVDKSLL